MINVSDLDACYMGHKGLALSIAPPTKEKCKLNKMIVSKFLS